MDQYQYKYQPDKIIFPYGYYLLMPALGVVYACLKKGIALNEIGVAGIFFFMFLFALAAPIIAWIANNISVRIDITDCGFRYKSLLKDREILWNNIIDIQRRILYERRGWHIGSEHENDLLIKLQDGTKIKIFGILQRCDGKEGGIEELEKLLQCKTNIQQNAPMQEKTKESKYMNYIASVGINVLMIVLYFKFLWVCDGILGLAVVYVVAIFISIFVLIYRKKTLQIDAILGVAGILGMVYALPYKKSWYLMAEIMMTIIAMYSVTYHYFDWKSLDERGGKKETE